MTTDIITRPSNVSADDLRIGDMIRYVGNDLKQHEGIVESVDHDGEGSSVVCLRRDGEIYCTDFLRYTRHFSVVN